MPFNIKSVTIFIGHSDYYTYEYLKGKKMEEGQSILERLNGKIDDLINKVNNQNGELEHLRNELTIAKAECEAKNNEITNLHDELANKEREIEGALRKIEEVLSN